MTQNIEQRTEVAVTKYEKASDVAEQLGTTDSEVDTPVGKRNSFPRISRVAEEGFESQKNAHESTFQQSQEVKDRQFQEGFESQKNAHESTFQQSQEVKDRQFQDRFSAKDAIEWQSGITVSDALQLYSTGSVAVGDYKVWLAEPSKLPFGTGGSFSDDLANGLWLEAQILSSTGDASKTFVKSQRTPIARALKDRFDDFINLKDFGAVADLFLDDGTLNPNATDNASAFQAAADVINLTVWNGTETIRIPVGAYGIGGEVNLGRANLSGEGFNRTRKAQIMPLDPAYEGKLFIWDGAFIENICFKGWKATNSTCIWMEGGYNRQIRRCEIGSFHYDIYVEGITVQFSVTDCTFHGGEYVFYCEDKDSRQSTTTYFRNCMFQWCNNAVVFEKDVFGSEFSQCIFEHVKGSALRAKWWGSCKFDTIWWEGRQSDDSGTRAIIEATTNSGFENCTGVNFYPRYPWIDTFNAETSDSSNALTQCHGVSIGKNAIRARNRYGASNNLTNEGGLHFDVDAWAGFRGLKLSTRNKAPDSSRVRHIDIAPGDGANLYIKSNADGSTRAPIIYTQINDLLDVNGNQVFLDTRVTPSNFPVKHESKPLEPSSKTMRRYDQAQVFLWDASPFRMPNNHGGFEFSLESEGIIVLDAVRGADGGYQAQEIFQPAVEVSGIFSSQFLLHRIAPVDPYSGGWGAYRAAKAIKIYFVNTNGEPVTPDRFTLTLRNRCY